MGAAMRRLDWARTPLGAVGKWPASLRAAARLNSFPRSTVTTWPPRFANNAVT